MHGGHKYKRHANDITSEISSSLVLRLSWWCAYVYFSALINMCTRLKHIGRANAENTVCVTPLCLSNPYAYFCLKQRFTLHAHFALKNTLNISFDVCIVFVRSKRTLFELTSLEFRANRLPQIIKEHKLCIWNCVFSALVNRAEESCWLLCRCAPCIGLTFMCRLPSQYVLNQRILRFVIIVVIAVSFSHVYLFLSAMHVRAHRSTAVCLRWQGTAFFNRCALCAAKKIQRLLLSPSRMVFPLVVCVTETIFLSIQFTSIRLLVCIFSSVKLISQEISEENFFVRQTAPCIQNTPCKRHSVWFCEGEIGSKPHRCAWKRLVEITYTANNTDGGYDESKRNIVKVDTRCAIKSVAFVSVTLAAREFSHGPIVQCMRSMHRRRFKIKNERKNTNIWEGNNNNGGSTDTRNNKCLRQRQQTPTLNSWGETHKRARRQGNKTKLKHTTKVRAQQKGIAYGLYAVCAYRFL